MDSKPAIAPLDSTHNVLAFDCGDEDLTGFLRQRALDGQRAHMSRSYVAAAGAEVVGFLSLCAGAVAFDGAPERLVKGVPQYPVPIILLARLAIDQRWQKKGLAAALLKHAIHLTLQVADIIGVRAMVVDAKHNKAKAFYCHFGFEPFSPESLRLFHMVKDLKRMKST